MAAKYPFKSGEELKKSVSQVYANIEIKNIDSSLKTACSEYKDTLGAELFTLMLSHYNSENYVQDKYDDQEFGLLNELVDLSKGFIGQFAIYEHFIWMQIHVSDKGITTYKTDNETTAFEYQTDQAKEKVLKMAWSNFGDIIDFLTKKSTKWTPWTAKTEYKANDIVYHDNKFYKANVDFTSGDEFVLNNWTEVASSEIKFKEWTLSEQYQELQELIFDSYKDFDKYYSINKNAAFYTKIRYIIQEVIADEISSRVEDLSEDKDLLEKVKRFTAYRSIAIAIRRSPTDHLPETMRTLIRERAGKNTKLSLESSKDALLLSVNSKADEYLSKIDIYLAKKVKSEDLLSQTIPSEEHDVSEDDKFISAI